MDIPGQCRGVTGRYANTLSVATLLGLRASVAPPKSWNAVLVNDKHTVRVSPFIFRSANTPDGQDKHSQPER